jgi:acyl-CoA reductase-like NAD-dependent aldehyde dehydrogenase
MPDPYPIEPHVAPIPAPLSLRERLDFVRSFRKTLVKNRAELCDLVSSEIHKPAFECLTSDIVPVLAACKHLEKHASALLAPKRLGYTPFWLKGTDLRIHREPLGRVAIIATWNYPIQLLGIQLVEAIVAGNTVVVKPSERSPRTHGRLIELAQECGLPPGLLTSTHATREAGANLLAAEKFDHVLFTGSTAIGKKIAQTLAGSLTSLTLELSGRDSALVLDDADPVLAAKCIWGAVCINGGQSCIAPRRALVHESVYEPFCETLRSLAAKTPPRTLIEAGSAELCYSLVSDAVAAGGRDASGTTPTPADGVWRPTAIIDCPRESALAQGHHFGPALAVIKYTHEDDALAIHQSCDQHLAVSIFTQSSARVRRLLASLKATNVIINDCILPTAHPEASIGGRGESGLGISRGSLGLLALTRPVFVSQSPGLMRKSLKPPPRLIEGMLTRAISWMYGR